MKRLLLLLILSSFFQASVAQGPPITGDKPIMLGGGSFTTKTLVEIRNTARGTAVYAPIMLHYLPTANSLVALHVPFISYDLGDLEGSGLSDLKVLAKYQFFRKDGTGKTFRMVAKTFQNIPTSGKDLDLMNINTNKYEAYAGVIAAYESLKYGISTEVGYNLMPNGTMDALEANFGVGLPLLKPQYPNKQVNLYFEYMSNWLVERDWYMLAYSQGVQYASKNLTLDLALQLPLIQDMPENRELNYSLFIGTRYTF